jgi:hypothetical protein
MAWQNPARPRVKEAFWHNPEMSHPNSPRDLIPEDLLLGDIADIVLYPEAWLDMPNDQLGGRPPKELLEGGEGQMLLHNLVQAVKHGMMS